MKKVYLISGGVTKFSKANPDKEERYQKTIDNYKKIGDRFTEQNHVIF